jgi:hypothetical protein
MAIRPGRPAIRTTFQFAGEIACESVAAEKLLDGVRRVALDWIAEKYPEPLPEQAMAGESFESDVPGQRLEAVGLQQAALWAIRLEQPDTHFGDRPAVAGRTWTTDLSVRVAEGSLAVGARVRCASLPECTAPIALTRPRVVRDWASRFDLRSLVRLSETPWRIATEGDLLLLHALVANPKRDLPVVVLTQPVRQHRGHLREWVLDEGDLGRRLVGIAHLVLLPSHSAFEWTRTVGKPWSVYNGAVRTYQPNLDFDLDSPFNHPLTTIDGILASRLDDLLSEKAFSQILVGRLADWAASRRVRWEARLFVPEARGLAAELDRHRLTEALLARDSTSNLVAELQHEVARISQAHESELASLRQQLETAHQDAEQSFDLAAETERDRDWYRQENANLRWQVAALRDGLRQCPGRAPDDNLVFPDGYDDLPDWVGKNLAGRLVLHPRAANAVKDATYEDLRLVCRALLLLANDYRDMRQGVEGAKQRFESGQNELGVRCDESITRSRAGEQGDTYFVAWPVGSGRKAFLEHHLRRGSTKDERVCLAIYFFWDDEAQQVVVGSLPSHLRNRMS